MSEEGSPLDERTEAIKRAIFDDQDHAELGMANSDVVFPESGSGPGLMRHANVGPAIPASRYAPASLGQPLDHWDLFLDALKKVFRMKFMAMIFSGCSLVILAIMGIAWLASRDGNHNGLSVFIILFVISACLAFCVILFYMVYQLAKLEKNVYGEILTPEALSRREAELAEVKRKRREFKGASGSN